MPFDVQQFMNISIDQPMDTQYTPIPDGEYRAMIRDVKTRMAKESVVMDVSWEIADESGQVKAITGMDKNVVRQGVFLDINASGTGYDLGTGKNVQLGKLRDAVGQNVPGQPWNQNMLKGAAALIRVSQRPADDGSGKVYNDVKAVTKLS